jgi:hypothetical protein
LSNAPGQLSISENGRGSHQFILLDSQSDLQVGASIFWSFPLALALFLEQLSILDLEL